MNPVVYMNLTAINTSKNFEEQRIKHLYIAHIMITKTGKMYDYDC